MKPDSFHSAAPSGDVPSATPPSASRAPKRSAQPRRLLADVLWEAANVHLTKSSFSCHAVADALRMGRSEDYQSVPHEFMRDLGCPSHAFNCEAWDWLYDDDLADSWNLRVQVRYMWLLLAMHVAEDEGITV